MRAIPESSDHRLGVVGPEEFFHLVFFSKLQRDKADKVFLLQRTFPAPSGGLRCFKSSAFCFSHFVKTQQSTLTLSNQSITVSRVQCNY